MCVEISDRRCTIAITVSVHASVLVYINDLNGGRSTIKMSLMKIFRHITVLETALATFCIVGQFYLNI
jgi:hypothetical protein